MAHIKIVWGSGYPYLYNVDMAVGQRKVSSFGLSVADAI